MRPGTLLRWYALKPILRSEIRNGSVILDIGGYDGLIATKLQSMKNIDISIIDIDKQGLKLAQDKGLKTIYASCLDLPIKNESADIVLALDLIEHVDDDGKLLKELHRVTKETGKLILTTPMKGRKLIPLLTEERMAEIHEQWGHIRCGYTYKELERLLKENGFSIIKRSSYFNILSRFAYYFGAFSKISIRGKWLLYRAVIRLEPILRVGCCEHVLVCRKEGKSK